MTDGNGESNLRELADQPFALLQEMERRALARRAGRDGDQREWVGIGLRVGEQRYVVAREEVREILKAPSFTRVPGAPRWLLGLANVRGQLLPIVDFGCFCSGDKSPITRQARIVLINHDEVPMAVLVDEVFGFRRFVNAEESAAATTADERVKPYLSGAYRRSDEVWPVLSFLALISSNDLLRVA